MVRIVAVGIVNAPVALFMYPTNQLAQPLYSDELEFQNVNLPRGEVL